MYVSSRVSFNPRAREGRDASAWGLAILVRVSIHAPARGATLFKAFLQCFIELMFQSTRPRGARPLTCRSQASCERRFNPRAREGRDPAQFYDRQPHLGFNPRAREGRDTSDEHACTSRAVSIHAPARGATPAPSLSLYPPSVSIHAPARGATRPRGARH